VSSHALGDTLGELAGRSPSSKGRITENAAPRPKRSRGPRRKTRKRCKPERTCFGPEDPPPKGGGGGPGRTPHKRKGTHPQEGIREKRLQVLRGGGGASEASMKTLCARSRGRYGRAPIEPGETGGAAVRAPRATIKTRGGEKASSSPARGPSGSRFQQVGGPRRPGYWKKNPGTRERPEMSIPSPRDPVVGNERGRALRGDTQDFLVPEASAARRRKPPGTSGGPVDARRLPAPREACKKGASELDHHDLGRDPFHQKPEKNPCGG